MAERPVNFLSIIVIFHVVLVSFAYNGEAVMPMEKFGVDACESVCVTAFADSKTSDQQTICQRGCRLMSMIGFMERRSTSEQLRDSCYKSCKEAYADSDSEAACAFGCQSQLPIAEERRKLMNSFDDNADDDMMMMPMMRRPAWSGMHDYGRRMMDCMMNYVQHQFHFGWYLSPTDGGTETEPSGQITVILSSGGGDDVLDSSEPADAARVVEVDLAPAVEQKTSTAVETNLAPVDRGATPDVKSSQVDSIIFVSRNGFPDNQVNDLAAEDEEGNSSTGTDWLFCLERKSGAMRKIVLVIFVLSLLVIIYICATSSLQSAPAPIKKVSIYGDLDYPDDSSKKQLIAELKPHMEMSAPPLPDKIPIHVI